MWGLGGGTSDEGGPCNGGDSLPGGYLRIDARATLATGTVMCECVCSIATRL